MIPFSPPHIDEKIVQEVSNALLSGWITTGPRTKKLEKEIGLYCNADHVLAVNSWTSGAEMLLKWFGVQQGDEVIIPAYTYCATANIIIHCGAVPVMVDIEEDFCISVEKLKNAITPKTKVIIPVDLGGFPCDYEEIIKVINSKEVKTLFNPRTQNQEKLGRILLLTDAAHSFGAMYNNKKIGTQADFAVFSFHAVKNLTTAEGGAICINLPKPFDNQELYNNLNTLSLHGQNKDALAKTQKGGWEYDVLEAGFKCNMTDILASIGLIELERYETESLPRRKEIFGLYTTAFEVLNWTEIPTYLSKTKESSYHLYLLRIKDITIEQRNEIINKIFDKGVSVNVHYKPLPLLTYYKNKGYSIESFPNTKNYWEREITLPVYVGLTDNQVQEVIKAVIDSYHEVII